MIKKNLIQILFILILLPACDDMEDKVPQIEIPVAEETKINRLFILSEGLFNMNNSTLSAYTTDENSLDTDFFGSANKRGLGDTANDMQLYGNKLYILVNVSSTIEVINPNTGASIKQISLFDENGIARQPRQIDFAGGNAYVCNFDGTVVRIDTLTLEVTACVRCGQNPDGICHANGKLYVSNSGGLNYPNYGNTVSVIDITTFTETKKITTKRNPYHMHTDSQGDVYVVCRGNLSDEEPYVLQRISSETDNVVQTFDNLPALNFTICNDKAYIYNYDFSSQSSWIKVLDCITEQITTEHFITDGTIIQTPYGIGVNPYNEDVYVAEAYNFTVKGDVLCFNKNGQLKFRLNNIGLNPNTFVFLFEK